MWSAPTPHEAVFQRLWTERREAMAAGETGDRYLDEIIQQKLDRGITNLWKYAILLLREGETLKDAERAITLGDFAQRMAPDFPSVYFYRVYATLQKNNLRFHAALENYAEGARVYPRNLSLASGKALTVLYIIGLGALLAILAFFLVVFFKRMPIFFQTVREELEGDVREMLWGVGRIFLLFLPLLLHLNILWCALVWGLVLWRYLTKGEKGIVIFSFLLVVYVFPVGGALFQFMEGSRAQVVLDMYEVSYGSRKPQAMERLRLWVLDHPEDQEALFTLALALKREGNYAEAKAYYQQVLHLNPSDARTLSNLGNLYMALNGPPKASTLYRQAIEKDPHNGAYYFNLSKALSQESMLVLQDADQYFQKAKSLSPQIIKAHLEIDSPHPNRNVIDTVIPLERLRGRFLREFWSVTGPSYFLLDVWLNDLSPRFPFVVPVLFVTFLIIVSSLGAGRGRWWRCSQCGMVSNRTVGKKEGRKNICVRCFRILQGKEMDQDLKESKLRETKGFQMRMEVYDKVFPFLIPGIGHIWKGYNARGFCYLWIFFIFVGGLFYWKGIIPPAIPSPTYGIFGGVPLFLAAMCLFYLAVLRGGYKKEGLEIVKPSFSLEGIRG